MKSGAFQLKFSPKLALIFAIVACNLSFTNPSAMAFASYPDSPTNVSVTAGNHSVDITWAAPADNGGFPIIGYIVRNQAREFKCVTTELFCHIDALTNGTRYAFFITAQNASIDPDTQSWRESFPVSIVATPATTPQPPSGVHAVSGNGSATITWNPSYDNGGSYISSYRVSSVDGSASCETSGNLVCAITRLTNGTPYQFTVEAINDVGSSGPSGASNSVTPTELNFDTHESLLSYLSAHPQARALPTGQSLYDIRCSPETNLLELGKYDTQTASAFTLIRAVNLPEPNISCDIQTAYGPSGLYMTVSYQGETSLYKVDMRTGDTNKVDLTGLEPSGIQPNQTTVLYNFGEDASTGALYYIFAVIDSNNFFSSLPLLYLDVLTPSPDDKIVSVVSQGMIGGWSSPPNPDNSGNTLVPLFDWPYPIPTNLVNGQIPRVFEDIAGLIDNGPVIGVVNQDGTIVRDAFQINGPGGTPQFVGLLSLDTLLNGQKLLFLNYLAGLHNLDITLLQTHHLTSMAFLVT